MPKKQQRKCVSRSATLTIPELEQSKAAVLNTFASAHSQRSYKYAIERFIAWYCDEPRLAFDRSVVMRYRSFLESLSLSAATINLHLSAIRRLADVSLLIRLPPRSHAAYSAAKERRVVECAF
jgi:hypothetical protein